MHKVIDLMYLRYILEVEFWFILVRKDTHYGWEEVEQEFEKLLSN